MTTTRTSTITMTLGATSTDAAAALAAEDARLSAELGELRMLRSARELPARNAAMLAGDAAARSERARARILATGGLRSATTYDLATWAAADRRRRRRPGRPRRARGCPPGAQHAGLL